MGSIIGNNTVQWFTLTKLGCKIKLKTILLTNTACYSFYKLYESRIPQSIVITVAKVLSYKNKVRAYKKYKCSNDKCDSTKNIPPISAN